MLDVWDAGFLGRIAFLSHAGIEELNVLLFLAESWKLTT